jgi:ribonuclease HI
MRCKKNPSSAGTNTNSTKSAATGQARSAKKSSSARTASASATRELDLPVAEVLQRFTDGPKTGVFTDGAANPNPGPGGWGTVYVIDDAIQGEAYGAEPHTTNNRMELLALRAGIALVPSETAAVIYTDSQLCVNTFTKWAKAWKARGWRRKEGEIKNLELVQEIYEALQRRPELKLAWIAAHSGNRWNEYADALATAYRRSVK